MLQLAANSKNTTTTKKKHISFFSCAWNTFNFGESNKVANKKKNKTKLKLNEEDDEKKSRITLKKKKLFTEAK